MGSVEYVMVCVDCSPVVEFTVNTTTTGTQYNPRLAALADGRFVAVYGDASSNDGSGYGVFSKVFNADGTQAVAEQVVSNWFNGLKQSVGISRSGTSASSAAYSPTNFLMRRQYMSRARIARGLPSS